MTLYFIWAGDRHGETQTPVHMWVHSYVERESPALRPTLDEALWESNLELSFASHALSQLILPEIL